MNSSASFTAKAGKNDSPDGRRVRSDFESLNPIPRSKETRCDQRARFQWVACVVMQRVGCQCAAEQFRLGSDVMSHDSRDPKGEWIRTR